MILHISRDRYDDLISQGYSVKVRSGLFRDTTHDVTYHLINGDKGMCSICESVCESIKPTTIAGLERIKAKWTSTPN